MKKVHCQHCAKHIEDRGDLVVVQKGIWGIEPYHNTKCYGAVAKGLSGLLVSGPINSKVNRLSIIFTAIITIVAFFLNIPGVVKLVVLFYLLYVVSIRAWSWFNYERHLST
ncbi:hypothetical protein PGLA_10435 [Paenibacillus glacialis]|uniref:Uncharacterized protein n=2 Tax=Paenibacillus glacialis TaxID=494026 RepID=A0A162Q499_9BACL|nr:hypothetical protein PGLA_10435 [Paenibacillus glacialis]